MIRYNASKNIYTHVYIYMYIHVYSLYHMRLDTMYVYIYFCDAHTVQLSYENNIMKLSQFVVHMSYRMLEERSLS